MSALVGKMAFRQCKKWLTIAAYGLLTLALGWPTETIHPGFNVGDFASLKPKKVSAYYHNLAILGKYR